MKIIRSSLFLAGALVFTAPLSMAQNEVAPNFLRADAADVVSARSTLLKGITSVAAPGLPGVISAFGPKSFPIIVGEANGGVVAPVVAAAFTPKGRIVGFGHDGFLDVKQWGIGQTRQLIVNSVNWTGQGVKKPIGIWAGGDSAGIVELLKESGIDATPVTTNADLAKYSVLVVNGHRLGNADEKPLADFLAAGGGLVMGTTGWGWNWQREEEKLTKDYFGNRVLASYGLVWSEGTIEGLRDGGANVFKVRDVPDLANAGRALDLLETSLKDPNAMSAEQGAMASRSISDLLTGLPATDEVMARRFDALLGNGADLQIPTRRVPLGPKTPAARLRYLLALRRSQDVPVAKTNADPAASTFPGAIPADAKPVTKALTIDLSIPQWHSMGLYAAPGAIVQIHIPRDAVAKKLAVRIGAHTDSLVRLDSWQRSPEISRLFSLEKTDTQVANSFGGLVYVVVPQGLQGQSQVTVAGAVEAPLFVKGKTNVDEWKNSIRNAPGPWAEIATDRVVITVPSVNVRDIDDPTKVLDLYDQTFLAMADLRGIQRLHPYPERIVADEQISAGYMHAGYPVMTWLDVQKKSVDYDQLMKESWGHWHEFGHNHQVPVWTPEGTGEVTNNLFALYVWETVMKKPDAEAHPALRPADFEKEWRKYDAGGRKFEDWKSNPFLALHSYLQLKNSFGWEPFKKVFREYEAMPEANRPQTDQERRDEWMIRFSRAVGKNLAPFYTAWGVPISRSAAEKVKDLTAWMPTTEQTLGIETNLGKAQ